MRNNFCTLHLEGFSKNYLNNKAFSFRMEDRDGKGNENPGNQGYVSLIEHVRYFRLG